MGLFGTKKECKWKDFNCFGLKAMVLPDGKIDLMEKDTPREGVTKVTTFSRMSDFVNHPLAKKVMIEDVECVDIIDDVVCR